MSNTRNRRFSWMVVWLLTLVGGLIRFADLGSHELWLDESLRIIWAIRWYEVSGTSLWEQATVGHAGSIVNIALSGFLWASTQSVFWLRAVQALCCTACIPLFYLQARRYLIGWPLHGAVALFAIAPMQVAIARQAEEYAFLILFGLLASLLTERVIESRRVNAISLIALGTVTLLGFLCGGYMLLPWFLALALVLVWKLRKELVWSDWTALAASQLPMVAVFFYSLTFWAIDPRPVITEYLSLMGGWIRDGSPSLPTSVIVDLFCYCWFWSWGEFVSPWVTRSEVLIGLLLIWFVWRGHQALREKAPEFAVPGAVLATFFVLDFIVFAAYTGRPFYFSRVYSPAIAYLLVLFVAGVMRNRLYIRLPVLGIIVAVMTASTMALKNELHLGRPVFYRDFIRLVTEGPYDDRLYVHPGEFRDVIGIQPYGRDLEMRGVWRESFATPEETVAMTDPFEPEGVEKWAARIASNRACVLATEFFLDGRDPDRELRARLVEQHGYQSIEGIWTIRLYCPDETKTSVTR